MADSFANYKILKSFRATVQDIALDSIQYLTTRFNQSRTVFTAASPFGQLLVVVENLTQLIFFYIEDAITELNINEATRLTSVYSLASLSSLVRVSTLEFSATYVLPCAKLSIRFKTN